MNATGGRRMASAISSRREYALARLEIRMLQREIRELHANRCFPAAREKGPAKPAASH